MTEPQSATETAHTATKLALQPCPESPATPASPSHRLRTMAKALSKLNQISNIELPSTPFGATPTTQIATMAILTMPECELVYDGFALPDAIAAAHGAVNQSYCRWLEGAGIRVMYLDHDADNEETLSILSQVNGVLLPGGDLDKFQDTLAKYIAKVRFIYDYAEKCENFVVWGICQGMQTSCAAFANDIGVIEPGFVGVDCKMMPLEIADPATNPDAFKARFIFGPENKKHIVDHLRNDNSTLNWHRWGVTPEMFAKTPGLRDNFTILSTNVDAKGRRFISTLEHKRCPFFLTQWHPEAVPFVFDDMRVEQNIASLAVNAFISAFLRRQLRKNKNHFLTLRALESHVVERTCPLKYQGFGWSMSFTKVIKKQDWQKIKEQEEQEEQHQEQSDTHHKEHAKLAMLEEPKKTSGIQRLAAVALAARAASTAGGEGTTPSSVSKSKKLLSPSSPSVAFSVGAIAGAIIAASCFYLRQKKNVQ